jgi:RNA polymerase sigma-32 factor
MEGTPMALNIDGHRGGSAERPSRYLQAIFRMPMLEQAEEGMLAKRWREAGDPEAADRLVTSHLRLVARIAMGYRGYGLPMSDLISEGNLGLLHALKRFDPDRGFRLSTYAKRWIRGSIQEYILRSWSLVRIGSRMAEKRLFFGLRRLKRELQVNDEGDLSPENVRRLADRLNVAESDVINMNRRLAAQDRSLNAPMHADGEGEWQDRLVDERESPDTELAERQERGRRQQLLSLALESLTDRERSIVTERRLRENPSSLDEVAGTWGISRERVRQIEMRAVQKLRWSVRTTRAGSPPGRCQAAAHGVERTGRAGCSWRPVATLARHPPPGRPLSVNASGVTARVRSCRGPDADAGEDRPR